jgi:hypothetical protein
MFCKKCGNFINDSSTFCANCGLRVKPVSNTENNGFAAVSRDGGFDSRPRFTYPNVNTQNQTQAQTADNNGGYPPNAFTNFMQAEPDENPIQTVFPEVITKEDTEQFITHAQDAGDTSLAGQISGLTARREELEQQTGGDDTNPNIPAETSSNPGDYTFDIYGGYGDESPVAARKVSEVERVYFGKGALVFCLTVIGLLSVTCGIFAGLYFSVI